MLYRKKIIILSSTGGGGHIASANALFTHLSQKYDIQMTYPFQTFLSPIQIFSTITFGRYNGEDLYNYFVRRGYNRFINFCAKAGFVYFKFFHNQTTKAMRKFLQTQKPDLVISLIPLINGATLEACKKLGIPFLLSPTDLDSTYFLCGIQKPSYEKFLYTIPFEDDNIRAIIKPAHIPDSQVVVSGSLVRSGFLKTRTTQEKEVIKKTWQIPIDKPIILILLGAQGSNKIIKIIKQLTAIKIPAHLLICIGKSRNLEKTIEAISFPFHITYTILGYNNHMPDLMAISDIFITKAGSCSFAEALYLDLPLLIDTTHKVLAWELCNVDFMEQHGFGKRINSLDQVVLEVENLLTNKEEYEAIKNRIREFPKKNGLVEITKLIERLLALHKDQKIQ